MAVHNDVKVFIDNLASLADREKVKAIRKCLVARYCDDCKLKSADRLALLNCLAKIDHDLATKLLLDIIIAKGEIIYNVTGLQGRVYRSEGLRAIDILLKKAELNSKVVDCLCNQVAIFCFYPDSYYLEIGIVILNGLCYKKEHIRPLLVLGERLKTVCQDLDIMLSYQDLSYRLKCFNQVEDLTHWVFEQL
jgi:hypothetical protein